MLKKHVLAALVLVLPMLLAGFPINHINHKTAAIDTTRQSATTPLYIIKGLRVDKSYIDKIDPSVIESIHVLKGEAAKQKYGRKAVDGAIEVVFKIDTSATTIYSQDELKKSSSAHDVPADFPGGKEGMMVYINKMMVYPTEARARKINGKVILSYVVECDGRLSNIKLEQGIGGGCDEIALQLLQKSPNWVPALKDGRPVRATGLFPLYFQLAY